MLACVCRPVTSTLPKPPTLSSAPQKRSPSMVVTCEPRTTSTIDKKVTQDYTPKTDSFCMPLIYHSYIEWPPTKNDFIICIN